MEELQVFMTRTGIRLLRLVLLPVRHCLVQRSPWAPRALASVPVAPCLGVPRLCPRASRRTPATSRAPASMAPSRHLLEPPPRRICPRRTSAIRATARCDKSHVWTEFQILSRCSLPAFPTLVDVPHPNITSFERLSQSPILMRRLIFLTTRHSELQRGNAGLQCFTLDVTTCRISGSSGCGDCRLDREYFETEFALRCATFLCSPGLWIVPGSFAEVQHHVFHLRARHCLQVACIEET